MDREQLTTLLEEMQVPQFKASRHQQALRRALLNSARYNRPRRSSRILRLMILTPVVTGVIVIAALILNSRGFGVSNPPPVLQTNYAQAKEVIKESTSNYSRLSDEQRKELDRVTGFDVKSILEEAYQASDLKLEEDKQAGIKILTYSDSQGREKVVYVDANNQVYYAAFASEIILMTGQGRLTMLNPGTGDIRYPAEGYELLYTVNYLPDTENIFLLRDKQLYVHNIKNGTIKKTSLPKLKVGQTTYEQIGTVRLSLNKSRALININTYDKNSPEYHNEFAGPQPISTRTIEYNFSTDTWENSSILETASSLVDDDSISFFNWDSEKNTIMGTRTGEGVGASGKVYIVDLNNKTYRTIAALYHGDFFRYANKNKIILSNAEDQLLIFDKSNLESPERTVDISQMVAENISYYKSLFNYPVDGGLGYIQSVILTPDQKELIVGFDTQIYAYNLVTNTYRVLYSDNTIGQSGLYWERGVAFDPSGKYLVWLDFYSTKKDPLLLYQDAKYNFYNVMMLEMGTGKVRKVKTFDQLIQFMSFVKI